MAEESFFASSGDIFRRKTAGISVYFDKQNRRYIRIDIPPAFFIQSEFLYKYIRNPLTSQTVPIRVRRTAHLFVFRRFVEELAEVFVDHAFIRADQTERTGGNAFRTFGRVAHDKNRLAQRRPPEYRRCR